MELAIITAFLKPIIVSVLSGIGYGLVMSAKKAVKDNKPESFDPVKLRDTAIISAIIGVLAWYRGDAITLDNYDVYVGANTGIVVIVQSGWQFLVRLAKTWLNRITP